MPTVYKRLVHFCHCRKRPPLSLEQKQVLGEIVRRRYFPSDPVPKLPPHDLIEQQEPEGTFRVISYPRRFIPTIDKIILSFYATLAAADKPTRPEHKTRQRIGGNKPLASFKTKR